MNHKLPAWAETVLNCYGPQPAAGATPEAVAKYNRITERFRRRWVDLNTDVWPLFARHTDKSPHLLALMIDMARHGSRTDLAAKRQALQDVERMEDELRKLGEQLRRKIDALDDLTNRHAIEGGIDTEVLEPLGRAIDPVLMQSWREPRLLHSEYVEATSSRKTDRDALVQMLRSLDMYRSLIEPVRLTARALAAIYNVAHDAPEEGAYNAEAVKKARADLRKRG